MLSVIVDYMARYGCYDVLSKQLLYIYHILITHCILWLFCVCFLLTPAIGLLIYHVTDMGAYKLISFLLHYICLYFHWDYEINLCYLILSYQMETFSALLALCAGNSPVTGEFPAQRPVTRSFDVFFDPRLNKLLSKQSWGWWFDTPSHSFWRHCNAIPGFGKCALRIFWPEVLREMTMYQQLPRFWLIRIIVHFTVTYTMIIDWLIDYLYCRHFWQCTGKIKRTLKTQHIQ